MKVTEMQEYRTLNKIRDLVADLGENSHVGAALEGCLEIAESNIRNDAFDSLKHKLDKAENDKKMMSQVLIGDQNRIQYLEKSKAHLSYSLERLRDTYTIETCPGCGKEQVIFTTGVTPCLDCGYPMAPCSTCMTCDYDTCPCGCDGTDADMRKRVTNLPVDKKLQSILYAML